MAAKGDACQLSVLRIKIIDSSMLRGRVIPNSQGAFMPLMPHLIFRTGRKAKEKLQNTLALQPGQTYNMVVKVDSHLEFFLSEGVSDHGCEIGGFLAL